MINCFFHKIFNWIWISSSNPTQVSLTVKSTLTVGAAALMQGIGLTHLNLGIPDLSTVINDISTVVLDALMLVGAVGTVVGAVTKVWLSITGKNPVINGTLPGTTTVDQTA